MFPFDTNWHVCPRCSKTNDCDRCTYPAGYSYPTKFSELFTMTSEEAVWLNGGHLPKKIEHECKDGVCTVKI